MCLKKLLKHIYEEATITVRVDEALKTKKIPVGKRSPQRVSSCSPLPWNIFAKLYIRSLYEDAFEDVFKSLGWDKSGIKIDDLIVSHVRFAGDVVLISEYLEEFKL